MKIVITGGHLSPALAVIEELPKNSDVLFIGRKYALEGDEAVSLEKQTIEKLGIPFLSITTGRIQRKFTKYTLFSLFKLPIGFYQAYKILNEFKPKVIIAFGGYISIPVGFAASLLKIPIVIHEQTLEAGVANKILSRLAKKVCISWESSARFFPKSKTIVTGNPLRKEFLESTPRELSFIPDDFEKENLPLVYVTGGSLGSHAINRLVEEALHALLYSVKIVHQTGDARKYQDFERLEDVKKRLSEKLQKRYVVTKFVMPQEVFSIMKKADLVISRSGVNTITELMFLNKMALLIPLPTGQHLEQKKNALFLKNKGLGEIVDQETSSSAHLLSVIEMMLKKKEKYSLSSGDEIKTSKTAAAKIVKAALSV